MSNSDKTISQLTSYLRGLSRRRNSRVVTADDVQNYLTRKAFRGDVNERLSITRSVLREPTFFRTGTVPSKRPAARGRRVSAWTI